MLERFNNVISLGRGCQTAHQIRRVFGTRSGSFFDWIGTPHDSLVALLSQHFEGAFELPCLMLSSDRTTVIDSRYGISYKHYFIKHPGAEEIDASKLEERFQEHRPRRVELIRRWHFQVRQGRTLFVRKDAVTDSQTVDLLQALRENLGHNNFHLLLALTPGCSSEIRHPQVTAFANCEVSPPSFWRGNNIWWDLAFAHCLTCRS